jgi:5-methyltetrahydrofolate--homocysteine methyltransferase
MTTTVPAMEEVIRELAKGKIPCKVMVGGAVLTQTYADRIGGGFFTPKTPWAPFIAPKRSSAETNHR